MKPRNIYPQACRLAPQSLLTSRYTLGRVCFIFNSQILLVLFMYVINFISHLDSTIRAIVHSKSEEFFKYLNVKELIRHLKTRQLLTEAEEATLSSSADRRHASKELIFEILPSKSPDAFLLFYEALQCEDHHKGHQYLVQLIQQG